VKRGRPAFFIVRIFLAALIENRKAAGARPVIGYSKRKYPEFTQNDQVMPNTQRIAKNTLMLYFRQILIMLVSLYTVRVVLETLGAEDYGIYNVAGGVVAMFSFVTGSLSAASQRFLAFELGRNDTKKFTLVFSQIIIVYIIFGIIILILAETVGLWFVSNKLVIPDGRFVPALWVYQCAVISFFITMMGVPYTASLIAYENMSMFAMVGIIEVILKLIIVFLLQIIHYDKLITYSLLYIMVTAAETVLYCMYVKINYKACSFRFMWDGKLIRTLTSYLGWNMVGSIVGVCKKHGVNIVLNLFSGPVVNGARAIAYQISAACSSFSYNFTTSVRPQITKSYAANNYDQMYALAFRGAKFSYFLMLLFSLPVSLEVQFLLSIWLKTVPEYTAVFAQLVLIAVLIEVISQPLITVVMAARKIRLYETIIGIVGMGNIPFAYWSLKIYGNPVAAFVIGIIVEILLLISRVCLLKYLVHMPILVFCKKVVFPIALVSISSILASLAGKYILRFISFRSLVVIPVAVLFVCITTLAFGMDSIERKSIFLFLRKKLKIHA
jgi:O-antigen/teichoic acid export membrane protein